MIPLRRTAFTACIAVTAIAATVAVSVARPDARTMTCHQTQALIEQNGAVVISTGQHTYERFVAYNGYCYHPEVRNITYISTRDTDECPVYHCERPIKLFDD
ncbi:MAG: hypothetical protein JJ913_01010 [Rhizobiaceae bacterium]|nr:hypothetical protein [Rhizobiaceae bacterium]